MEDGDSSGSALRMTCVRGATNTKQAAFTPAQNDMDDAGSDIDQTTFTPAQNDRPVKHVTKLNKT